MLLGNTPRRPCRFAYRTLTLYGRPFKTVRLRHDFLTPPHMRQLCKEGPTTPHTQPLPGITHTRFSLIRFRSPLLTEYLFLSVLRCFTSRRSLHTPYTFRCRSHHITGAGFPHSDTLGSQLVCQLPEAYRRLPRPSSAPDAKASTVCSKTLDHKDHKKDARVHYTVLKQPPHKTHQPPKTTTSGQHAQGNQNNTTHVLPHNPTVRPHPQTKPPTKKAAQQTRDEK